ncbi:MAG: alpha/beta hydrolase [Rhodobacteraceae bacterium]|nr:alpha/beta hydrolase [Paracoccaceae bacterium]
MFNPVFLLAAVVCLCMIAWFFRRPFTSRTQQAAPGEFARLTDGLVHYQWHGSPGDPVLVLVHGLTTPSFVWRDMIPPLVSSGYRVLTFDHFGRGFSDRPRVAHTTEFYIREMDELIAALEVKDTFHLLGYSMGGGIVSSYAAQRQGKLRKLVLLAPIGFRTELGGFFHWAAAWPVIGDLAMYLIGGVLIRRGARTSAQNEGVDHEMIQLQCHETRYNGFLTAVLSSIRNVTQLDLSETHRLLADRDVPLLAVFGKADDIIPIAGAMSLRMINRDAEIVELAEVGHAMAFTHSRQVTDAVVSFLSRAEIS